MLDVFPRPVRGVLHGIILIASLVVLALSAKSCAEMECLPKRAFLVATGVFSTLLTILLSITLGFVIVFPSAIVEAILSIFLAIWWSAAAGIATTYAEQVFSPQASLLVGFVWLAQIIAFVTAYAALVAAVRSCLKIALRFDSNQNSTVPAHIAATLNEEVPESVRMNDQAVGDSAWKTPNLA